MLARNYCGKLAYKEIHEISDQPDNEDLFES
jgi:hypothetical protein